MARPSIIPLGPQPWDVSLRDMDAALRVGPCPNEKQCPMEKAFKKHLRECPGYDECAHYVGVSRMAAHLIDQMDNPDEDN